MPKEVYHNIFYKIFDTDLQNQDFIVQTYNTVYNFKVENFRILLVVTGYPKLIIFYVKIYFLRLVYPLLKL